MVTFQLFARLALRAHQGDVSGPLRSRGFLGAPVRLNREREQAMRVRLEPGEGGWLATPTGAQGSHRLTSMLGAGALAVVPAGEGELGAGEHVELELL